MSSFIFAELPQLRLRTISVLRLTTLAVAAFVAATFSARVAHANDERDKVAAQSDYDNACVEAMLVILQNKTVPQLQDWIRLCNANPDHEMCARTQLTLTGEGKGIVFSCGEIDPRPHL
jgi:hypothetical protein